MLVGTVSQAFGTTIPFYVYLPYVPFELVVGVWLVIAGARTGDLRLPRRHVVELELGGHDGSHGGQRSCVPNHGHGAGLAFAATEP